MTTIQPVLAAFFLLSGSFASASDDPSYLKALVPHIKITPLLTAGETVPRTSDPSQTFRLVGVPDGMGIGRDAKGRIRLFVSHELKKSDVSQPLVGAPLVPGSFVSELLLEPETARILSGDLAATTVLDAAGGFPRIGTPGEFCSGFLAGPREGLDRPIYLTGEEEPGKDTFDGRGGLTFAFVDGVAYPLPDLGRFQKENAVVVTGTGLKTAAFVLEDGPKGYHSQLYLYVGEKKLSSKNLLEKNGLTGGGLYVFVADRIGAKNEGDFHKRDHAVLGRWVKIPKAGELDDAELNRVSTEAGAFHFDRIEDGVSDPRENGIFYFVTTGGSSEANKKGRLYKLSFVPGDPAGGRAVLEILLEGDAGDPIVNPDNLDMNARGEMLILEDFTVDNYWTLLKRTPSIWLYQPGGQTPVRLAEVNGTFWEPSGAIDASEFFGPGSWLVNVQAHTVSSAEASRRQGINGDAHVVQGGQILLLRTGPSISRPAPRDASYVSGVSGPHRPRQRTGGIRP